LQGFLVYTTTNFGDFVVPLDSTSARTGSGGFGQSTSRVVWFLGGIQVDVELSLGLWRQAGFVHPPQEGVCSQRILKSY